MTQSVTRRASRLFISESSERTAQWLDEAFAKKVARHGQAHAAFFLKSEMCSQAIMQLMQLPTIIESIMMHGKNKAEAGWHPQAKTYLNQIHDHIQGILMVLMTSAVVYELIEKKDPQEVYLLSINQEIEESINQGIKNGNLIVDIAKEVHLSTMEPEHLIGFVFNSIKFSASGEFLEALWKIITLGCILEVQLESWAFPDPSLDFFGAFILSEAAV